MTFRLHRKISVLAVCWLVLGLLGLGSALWLRAGVVALGAARHATDRWAREWQALAASVPAPTVAAGRAIQSELATAAEALAELQEAMTAGSAVAEQHAGAVVPTRRAEAYFDLAAFREAMRLRARLAGVVVRPDEGFGFAAYAQEAPEAGRIRAVFRERQQVQYLVETLLAAQPAEFLGVEREEFRPDEAAGSRPSPRAGRPAAAAGPGTRGTPAAVAPALTLRVAGCIEATSYRVTFTARTEVLRRWLNRLAEFELPVVVRAVEAGPVKRQGDAGGRAGRAPEVIVASVPTRFSVTVEFVSPVIAGEPAT